MAIVFDVDGPLVHDRTPHFFTYAAEVEWLRWDYRKFVQTGDLAAVTNGLSVQQLGVIYQRFVASSHCVSDQPTAGAKNALALLNGRPRYVVTARAPGTAETTTAFLTKHYGPFQGYRFGCQESKSSVVATLSASFFVDDNVKQACSVAELDGVVSILFPVRNVRRPVPPQSNVVIYLEAEQMVEPGMSDQLWDKVCRQAWQQITAVISAKLVPS